MNKFLVIIERKPGFSGNSIPEHRTFLQSQRENDCLISAGGFIDQTGGAYVLQAKTYEDAFQIMKADPMFAENECVYKLKEWNVQ
jgi:uncharacterized protein YciI